MTTVPTTLFTDAIYGKKTVRAINKALRAGDGAVTTWFNIQEIMQELEGCGLDSAPRDFLIELIVEDLKLPNWQALARAFGWKRFKETRPEYWTGVDAQEHFDGKFPINWLDIEWVAEQLDHDPCAVYSFYMECAVDAQREGDLEGCSAFACQGLAAMNYLLTEVV
jgi:hypothetical protein